MQYCAKTSKSVKKKVKNRTKKGNTFSDWQSLKWRDDPPPLSLSLSLPFFLSLSLSSFLWDSVSSIESIKLLLSHGTLTTMVLDKNSTTKHLKNSKVCGGGGGATMWVNNNKRKNAACSCFSYWEGNIFFHFWRVKKLYQKKVKSFTGF